MNVSRSVFLKVCATALAGFGAQSRIGEVLVQASAPAEAARPSATGRFDWATASAAMFAPHLHSVFTARAADGGSTLLALERVIAASRQAHVEQFSLVFHSSAAGTLHGLHNLHHAVLGEFELYIAPIGVRRGRVAAYEACFSRVVHGAAHNG